MEPIRSAAEHSGEVEPTQAQILHALERVLQSELFRRAGRLSRFLSFLVRAALNGSVNQLKEYAIGVEVFDRRPDYDPRLDPIVRVEARRLRAKLSRFYATIGKEEEVQIGIAARGYVPHCCLRDSAPRRTDDAARETLPAIAVLPFSTTSDDKLPGAFGEAIAGELAHWLTSSNKVQVVARRSLSQLPWRELDVRDLGAELNADYILDGSIWREGSQARVLAHLASSESGFEVWSGAYDLEISSPLQAQSAVARSIAVRMETEIDQSKLCPAVERSSSRKAHALYQRGRRYLASRTATGIRRSLDCFEEVLTCDPKSALAYAGMADAYSLGARYDFLPPHDAWRKAYAAALTAVETDQFLAEAHAALGFVELHYNRNLLKAERAFCTAMQLNPDYAPARQWYAWCLAASGRGKMAVSHIEKALTLDPNSPNASADLALAHYFCRDYEASVRQCNLTLSIAPSFYRAHHLLGSSYLQMAEFERALHHFEQASRSAGRKSRISALIAYALEGMGRTLEARRVADDMEQDRTSLIPAIDRALLASLAGNYDRAFEWFERAPEQDDGELIWLPIDPIYDPVRSDPRFPLFLERILHPS